MYRYIFILRNQNIVFNFNWSEHNCTSQNRYWILWSLFFYSTNSQSGNCMTILHCLLVLFVFAFWMLNTYMYIVLKWCSKIITHSEARELVHSSTTINIQWPQKTSLNKGLISLLTWVSDPRLAVTHSQLYKHMKTESVSRFIY